MKRTRGVSTKDGQPDPVMVPGILQAVLWHGGVSEEEFLNAIEIDFAKSDYFDSAKSSSRWASGLSRITAEPVIKPVKDATNLLIEIDFPEIPGTFSNIQGFNAFELANVELRAVHCDAKIGCLFSEVIDHHLFVPFESRIVDCIGENGHTVFTITMPLVPLVRNHKF